ncbi:MAG: ESPR-type extended signal peptide-containing protein [Comamonas sp.]
MNKTYRSIWNASLGSWVAAPETARHGSGKTKASVLVLATALLASNVVHADTTVTLSDQQISSTSYATTPSDNLILSISNGTATQSGDISGTGSLVKDGAGTVVLSGNNTHSGGTAINAGALQVNQ